MASFYHYSTLSDQLQSLNGVISFYLVKLFLSKNGSVDNLTLYGESCISSSSSSSSVNETFLLITGFLTSEGVGQMMLVKV